MQVIGAGSVHVFDAVDEGPHPPGPQELWQESVVLVWWDLKQGIGGMFRIGHELNWKDGAKVVLWHNTTTPQGTFKKTHYLPLRPEDQRPRGFGSGDGSVRFDHDGDCVWTLDDPDIHGILRVHDFHAAIDCYPKTGAISEYAPQHLEVAGRVSGNITVKGVDYAVDALGIRDHGWGTRSWDSLLSHRWCAGAFGPEMSFVAVSWHTVDDTMAQFGWVVRGDTVTFANLLHILALVDTDGISNRGGQVTFELTTGEVLKIDFRALAPCCVSYHHGTACADTLCEIRCGDLVGIADFESTHNAQGGKRRPSRLGKSGIIDNGWHPSSQDLDIRARQGEADRRS